MICEKNVIKIENSTLVVIFIKKILFMKIYSLLLLSVFMMSSVSFSQTRYTKKDIKKLKLEEGIYANMSTNRGDILLFLEKDKTPMTVASFVGLAEGDFKNDTLEFKTPYFDGILFHRVIANFMIQGGDPTGTGSGGPGYKFYDEFDTSLTHSGPGILSMANAGPTTNGSQFFITHKATPHLNNKHSVFGHVMFGQEVVDAIKQNDTIQSVKIYRIGKTAKKFNASTVFKSTIEEIDNARKAELANRNEDFRKQLDGKYENATQTESGLMYIVEQEGDGIHPKVGNEVTVHYTGYFTNGKKFDSSVDRGQPFVFPLGKRRVIAGWDEGVALMSKGAKHKLILPYWLGYGTTQRGPIPAKSTLIFDVELLSFK